MNRYPIYIISKGRWESRLTSKALEEMNTPYHIVIEPQEYNEYAKVINKDKILILPFSNLGQGSIPARNWVWEHSISIGAKRHWILDDNIRKFYRLNNNSFIKVKSSVCFQVIEDFVDRYKNISMAGIQYKMFEIRNTKYKPFILNTRIYSCILLKNDINFRWRGKYNEDTDLSLRILKNGDCTMLFYIFSCAKQATMSMSGGNMESLYMQNKEFDGRLAMARSLKNQHPEIVKIKKKWGRWQHSVNYRPFRNNKLIKKDIVIDDKINNYGMKVININ